MKPIGILEVLDLACSAREKNQIFNPLFIGEAGLGKSAICQQWVKKKRETNPNFGFIDLRLAYQEAPDVIGFPEVSKDENGMIRTFHRLPEIWPTDGEGLLLIEEPNRAQPSVMNCLMQILTDRKIHMYDLPKGWVIAGCINPDSAEYDVNHMDAALRNRFEEFVIDYDHMSFVNFIEEKGWHEDIKMFVSSGLWVYKVASEIAADGKYISPRTWEKMNAALVAGVKDNRRLHSIVSTSTFGRHIGNEFHRFCYDQSPVTAEDVSKDKKSALKKLKDQSDPNNYKGEMIAITVESIIKNYGGTKDKCKDGMVCEEDMVEIMKIIPSDQAVVLLKGVAYQHCNGTNIENFIKSFIVKYPELMSIMKSNIKISRGMSKTA